MIVEINYNGGASPTLQLKGTHIAVVELEDLWAQYRHRGYESRYDVVVTHKMIKNVKKRNRKVVSRKVPETFPLPLSADTFNFPTFWGIDRVIG